MRAVRDDIRARIEKLLDDLVPHGYRAS